MGLGLLAQAPQKMSYQAVVRSSSGQLVINQAVGMKTSILERSPTGTVVYQEIYNPNPETNENGLVTIEIGGGLPMTGPFSSISWSEGSYYLKIETDPSGGTSYTIIGTSQLLSVPYALNAIEKDPVFGASPAKGITSGNITNWNTAFGWGNHAGLYRPISYVPAWSEITSKPTSVGGYGITDAVTITEDQTISGIKTFNTDLLINTLTLGKGKNGIATNTAFGYQAMHSVTTGGGNTAVGYKALYSDITGAYNTAYGYEALNLNTGFGNTATGVYALAKNSTGEYNTAAGFIALYNNTTGKWNTALGHEALYLNSTGSNNTAIGKKALYFNNASGNTAIGHSALLDNLTGNHNTAVGEGALQSNDGSDNTAVGQYAMLHNYSGSFNTAQGSEALRNYKDGSYNTAVGFSAMRGGLDASTHHNTAVGYQSMNAIIGGHNNTSTGSISLLELTTGSGNTASGFSALSATTTGSHNTGIGVNAGTVNTTGSDNTCIGYFSNVGSNNLTNATAVGYNAIVNASNKIVLGNASATTVGGYGNWTNYSDSRLKENITYKDDLGLDFITRLKTVEFNYKEDENKRRRDGLIAQDVQKVLKDLHLEFSGLVEDDDKERTLNLSYGDFVIPLVNAVQEQQKLIEDQQKQIFQLKLALEILVREK